MFFITTANTLDTIPRPLLDRMELLRLAGYSEEEKIEIAKRYLIPRQLKETGLKPEDCVITDEALKAIIAQYTREAGVRQLERAIGRIARKVAVRYAEGHTEPVTVGANDLVNLARAAALFARAGASAASRRRGHRAWLDRNRRRGALRRSNAAAQRARYDAHRPTRRGDAGVRARGAKLYLVARARARHRSRSAFASTAFTSTSRPERFPKTARRPA